MARVRRMDLEVATAEDCAGLVERGARRAGRADHRANAEVVLVELAGLAVILGAHVEPVAFLPADSRLVEAPRPAVVGLVDIEVVIGTARLLGARAGDLAAVEVLHL